MKKKTDTTAFNSRPIQNHSKLVTTSTLQKSNYLKITRQKKQVKTILPFVAMLQTAIQYRILFKLKKSVNHVSAK